MEDRCVDNLIIGTGVAGLATAMALRERGEAFRVLDVAYDLDQATQQRVAALARKDPTTWSSEESAPLFPAPVSSAQGVERRLLFGSDFPYKIPRMLRVSMQDCDMELSHGLGGFGNVWGAAMLPYSSHSLRNWPIQQRDLTDSYRNVLKYVPLSAEADGLSQHFPIHSERGAVLATSARTRALQAAFESRRAGMRASGIEFGRARVAVDAGTGDTGCRYCGYCLDGCVYGSIFNPRMLWPAIEATEEPIHRGQYALEFHEGPDDVCVTAIDVADESVSQWRAKRVFLGSGHLATTRMIARSLGRLNTPIRIPDSQYFFFPMLTYGGVGETPQFALAEMFVEIQNERIADDYLHFQLYGMNRVFQHTFESMLPGFFPLSLLARRFYLFQGYLPSTHSGHLELEIVAARDKHDEVVIRGVANPQATLVARKAQALLRRKLLTFGIIPPFFLQMVPPGRSFHTGGSFPMGASDPVFSSDVLGRPAGLKRVHIVDSASFPSIASSTIGFTIMANADRIARAATGSS